MIAVSARHSPSCALRDVIANFQQRTPIRARSLIISTYGDVVEPHGGSIWLGSLIALLAPLQINERLIRTSIFRLAKEGWVTAEKTGRRSYYALTESGRRRFEPAFKRVYRAELPLWDGTWCLLLLSQLSAERRKYVREELRWQGFAAFSPTLLANPHCDRNDLITILHELGVADDSIMFETRLHDTLTTPALYQQVRQSWHLDELAQYYRQFIQLFDPLWQALNQYGVGTPQEAFLARLLLIHEYRRLQLRDPGLPDELLPAHWEGHAARTLCRQLYRLVYARSEHWLDEIVGTQWTARADAIPVRWSRSF